MEKVLGDTAFLRNRQASHEEEQFMAKLVVSLPKIRTYEISINPANVVANTKARQTFTVAGVKTTDILCVNPPALTAGLDLVGWRITAANTVQLVFWNSTGSDINEPAGNYLMFTIGK